MTHAQKIRETLSALDEALICVSGSILPLDMQVLKQRIIDLQFAYAFAWKQAAGVADENFERAQKLADQVQDNVKHIELMSEQIKAMGEYMESRGFVILRNSGGQVAGIAEKGARHD